MGNKIDLMNQSFNHLTVVEQDFSRSGKGKGAYWLCKCDCGNPELKSVAGSALRKGSTKSCGKCVQYQTIGKKFGHLTVLAIEEDYAKNNKLRTQGRYYRVQCDCKNKTIFVTHGAHLRDGLTTSCGCQGKIKDITGKVFGFLEVIGPTDRRSQERCVIWRCKCLLDGHECDVSTSDLISGQVSSCGCLRSSIGEKHIERILQDENIPFEKEKKFDDLGLYRYDFYLPSYNRLIEFDGAQHFTYSNRGWNDRESFEKTQKHDKIKNEYAISHNIDLVRIPYWERDSITLDMILGNQYLLSES